MASFTDKPLQLNPYIQQIPVEDYARVGMIKQKAYDENLQKVNAYLETIAGMPVLKEEHKEYLNGRLGELKGALQGVASSDFSNNQLMSQIGGLAAKVQKDPILQSAVSSTMKYQKELSAMETAKKEGKSSAVNEWDFQNKFQSWLNDGDLKSQFTGSYVPYSDYKKKALEALKSLTGDETIRDIAFDSKGQITDAIVREKLKGIPPQKVQAALMAVLSPDDMNQLAIEGRYNYSNMDDQRFSNTLAATYNEKIKGISDKIKEFETAMSSTTSAVEKQKIVDNIEKLKLGIDSLKVEHANLTKGFADGDVEGAKAQLQTRNFINNFSNAFSYMETSQTYENSPLAQIQMQREIKDMEWKKFEMNYNQTEKWKTLEFAQKEKELALKQKEGEGYGGLPETVDQSKLPEFTLSKVVEDITAGQQAIQTSNNQFLQSQGKDQKWLDAQKAAWQQGKKIDPVVANHLENITNQEREVTAKKAMVSKINKEAEAIYGTIDQHIPADIKPITYYSEDGSVSSYTPKELADFNLIKGKYAVYIPGTGAAGVTKYDDAKAKLELSPKMYKLYEMVKGNEKAGGVTKAQRNVLNRLQEVNQKVNQPYQEQLKAINDYTAKKVTERLTSNQGVSYGLPTGTAVQKSTIKTSVNQVIDRAEKQKGGIANSPDFDADKAREINSEEGATYSLKVIQGTAMQPSMYEVTVSGKKGTQTFNLTPEEKQAVFGNDYEGTPEQKAFAPFNEQIRRAGGTTTNLDGPGGDVNSAYLTKIDFPNVQNYGVKADIVKQGNQYSLRLNVYDHISKTWKKDLPFPRNTLTDEKGIMMALQSLNDASLFQLLHEKAPSAAELKALEDAAKKPL